MQRLIELQEDKMAAFSHQCQPLKEPLLPCHGDNGKILNEPKTFIDKRALTRCSCCSKLKEFTPITFTKLYCENCSKKLHSTINGVCEYPYTNDDLRNQFQIHTSRDDNRLSLCSEMGIKDSNGSQHYQIVTEMLKQCFNEIEMQTFRSLIRPEYKQNAAGFSKFEFINIYKIYEEFGTIRNEEERQCIENIYNAIVRQGSNCVNFRHMKLSTIIGFLHKYFTTLIDSIIPIQYCNVFMNALSKFFMFFYL